MYDEKTIVQIIQRVCHDISGDMGAAYNTLELLECADENKEYCELARKSLWSLIVRHRMILKVFGSLEYDLFPTSEVTGYIKNFHPDLVLKQEIEYSLLSNLEKIFILKSIYYVIPVLQNIESVVMSEFGFIFVFTEVSDNILSRIKLSLQRDPLVDMDAISMTILKKTVCLKYIENSKRACS